MSEKLRQQLLLVALCAILFLTGWEQRALETR